MPDLMSAWSCTASGELGERLVTAVSGALATIERCIRPGRDSGEPARYLSAGGGYVDPWTRDAAINAWSGVSLLDPALARDTLLMVCDTDAAVVVQDDQWWDQVIWIVAAAHHCAVSGDRDFARVALPIAVNTMALALSTRLDEGRGLFRGPALMQDGIAGYPQALVEPGVESSFVLDHPRARDVFCLSTNLVYAMAFDALADLAGSAPSAGRWRIEGERLRTAIRAEFGRRDGGFAYILEPRSDGTARRHEQQEALGYAMAVLSGTVTGADARALIASAVLEPRGIALVRPHMQDFSDSRPGRHNMVCWPMAMGMWARAAAEADDVEGLRRGLDDLLTLVEGSGGEFFEIYNAQSGAVDGGWQVGRHWRSEPDQTWSATALIGIVLYGLLGMRVSGSEVTFRPVLPIGVESLTLAGLRIRGREVSVGVDGCGIGARRALDGDHLQVQL